MVSVWVGSKSKRSKPPDPLLPAEWQPASLKQSRETCQPLIKSKIAEIKQLKELLDINALRPEGVLYKPERHSDNVQQNRILTR